MSSDQRLKELSDELGATMERIKQMEKKPPFMTRMKRHFRAQGGNIVNMLLAGAVVTASLGRLQLKQQFEVSLFPPFLGRVNYNHLQAYSSGCLSLI